MSRQLLEHRLIRPSSMQAPDVRSQKMLTRYRVQSMGGHTQGVTRPKLMLDGTYPVASPRCVPKAAEAQWR